MSSNSRWPAFISRVRELARRKLRNNTTDGIAVISVNMLVAHSGDPIFWLEPTIRRIEPSRSALSDLLGLFGQEDSLDNVSEHLYNINNDFV